MRFDDVVVGHIGWISPRCLPLFKHKADADDLAQETLLRIYANRESSITPAISKPWALTIMTNIVKTQHARKEYVPFVGIDDDF